MVDRKFIDSARVKFDPDLEVTKSRGIWFDIFIVGRAVYVERALELI